MTSPTPGLPQIIHCREIIGFVCDLVRGYRMGYLHRSFYVLESVRGRHSAKQSDVHSVEAVRGLKSLHKILHARRRFLGSKPFHLRHLPLLIVGELSGRQLLEESLILDGERGQTLRDNFCILCGWLAAL